MVASVKKYGVYVFKGEELETVETHEEQGHWVGLRRLCDNLGIDYHGQRQRLSDPDRCSWAEGAIRTFQGSDAIGRQQEMVFIHRRIVNIWLGTISLSRLEGPIRDKVKAYQKECADALYEHFLGSPKTQSTLPPIASPVASTDPVMTLASTLSAIAEMVQRVRIEQLEAAKATEEIRKTADTALAEAVAARESVETSLKRVREKHLTIANFFIRCGCRNFTQAEARDWGGRMTDYCRVNGIDFDEWPHPKFPKVNAYPESALRKFFFEECKSISTPIRPHPANRLPWLQCTTS